jgi:succinate dehydrogenase / fumarate reductase flavoprotein subunit
VRRWCVAGRIAKYEFWDFLGPILDSHGTCRGCVGQDLATMEIRAFPADALIIASGGCGLIYGRSTMSMACTGSAASRAFQAGAKYANAEFIQVHPTCIPGEDKLRLMSESARGEGGRVWVPKTPGDKREAKAIPENDRWYFLEEWYPKYGNLVPRDIATRAIHKVVYEHNLGIDGKPMVYLDLTHIDRKILDRKLEGILEIYEKFVGTDPGPVGHQPDQHEGDEHKRKESRQRQRQTFEEESEHGGLSTRSSSKLCLGATCVEALLRAVGCRLGYASFAFVQAKRTFGGGVPKRSQGTSGARE